MEESYDINCPKCNQKMEQGYIYSSQRICWTDNDKAQLFAGDESLVGPPVLKMKKLAAYKCDNCKIAIFEYNS